MDINNLCMGCMKELSQNSAFCPHCGYKSESVNSSRGLQPRSILNGKYLVGKIIGEGGFGITYIAYDLILNSRVAIKEYFPSELVTRDTSTGIQTSLTILTNAKEEQYKAGIERFVQEARNLAKFNNLEGIVSVKEFFYENNTAYMVMEYIDGVTLSKYLEKHGNKLPYDQVIIMMAPVMDSLEKIHAGSIVHRDISPDNIMVSDNGAVKLIDFGAARIVDNTDQNSLTVILKHGYAPEEQYQSHGNQGPWTDIYALSATMYRMITGIVPQESTDRVLSGDKVVPVNKLVSEVPKRISDAIMHGLAIKATNRPQTIADFKTELEKGRKKVLPFIIAGSATITVLLGVVCIIIAVSTVKKIRQAENKNSITVDETSVQTADGTDLGLFEKTESELISTIETTSGSSIKYGIYDDYDLDGIKEYFAFVCMRSDADDDYGQIWFANSDGARMVFDTRKESDYDYFGGNIINGLLHFDNGTHYFIISGDNNTSEGEVEEITFAYENGSPRVVYQGTNIILEEDGRTFVEKIQHDEAGSSFVNGSYIYKVEYAMKYEITYREGYYSEYSVSIMPDNNVFNITLNERTIKEGIEQVKKEKASFQNNAQYSFSDYPYIVYEDTYYCSNGHLYKNISFYDSKQTYDENQFDCNTSDIPQKLEACLEFAPSNGKFEYIGFTYGKMSELTSLNSFYVPIPLGQTSFDDNQSDEEYKNTLLSVIKEYFGNYADIERDGIRIDGLEYLFEDFNNDGKTEMIAVVNAPIENPYPSGGQFETFRHQAVLFVNENGVVVLRDDEPGDTTSTVDLTRVSFGKIKMFSYSISDWVGYSSSYIFSVTDDGINCVNMRNRLPDNLWDSAVRASENGIYIDYTVYVNYDANEKKYYIDGSSVNAVSGDSIKLWYLNDRFVECASVEINEDELRKYSGAEDILERIDEIVSNYEYGLGEYLYTFNSDEYQIDSILKCSDDFIYINYVPYANVNNYSQQRAQNVDGIFSYIDIKTYTIKLSYTDDKVEFDSVYRGYRQPRLTGFEAYYPQ